MVAVTYRVKEGDLEELKNYLITKSGNVKNGVHLMGERNERSTYLAYDSVIFIDQSKDTVVISDFGLKEIRNAKSKLEKLTKIKLEEIKR